MDETYVQIIYAVNFAVNISAFRPGMIALAKLLQKFRYCTLRKGCVKMAGGVVGDDFLHEPTIYFY